MPTNEEYKSCELCGATIYPEHLKSHMADTFAGKLLCAHCLKEKKEIARVNPAAAFAQENPDPENEPIALVFDDKTDSPDDAGSSSSAIHAFGGTYGGAARPEEDYKRPLVPDGHNATRCRTFHCKLNDVSMRLMNEQINDWVDQHPSVSIKFCNTCIGVVEGKSADPHLIMTIFY